MEEFAHILIDMADELDCRFIGSWFVKAADAQLLWLEIAESSPVRESVQELSWEAEPVLDRAASFIFGALERHERVFAFESDGLSGDQWNFELAMLILLGFFELTGQSYRLTLPDIINIGKVREAASRVLYTVADDGLGPAVKPERLLHTLPTTEAEAWRSSIIQLRHLNSGIFEHEYRILDHVRLRLSNGGFRIGTAVALKLARKLSLREKIGPLSRE